MSDRLTLDYNNMFAVRLGGRGLDPARLDGAAEEFGRIHGEVERRRDEGELGFLALPGERETVGRIRAFADGVGQAFDTVVVLGIGGSALGATALREALLTPGWNELSDEQRDYFRACTSRTTWTLPPSARSSTGWTCGARSSTW